MEPSLLLQLGEHGSRATHIQLREIHGEDRILTILSEDRRGDKILEDPAVSVERTNHLTPHQEFAHLLRKLPKFLLRHYEHRPLLNRCIMYLTIYIYICREALKKWFLNVITKEIGGAVMLISDHKGAQLHTV